MTELHQNKNGVLYIIICAAPLAQQMQDFIVLARAAQWEVCAIATPQATKFIDEPLLTKLTGYPVRSDYKLLGTADILPKADSMLVVPATFNTINKWVLGIGDTLALSILCESLGRHIPILAVPYLKNELAYHPAFSRSITTLREWGVRVLYEPEKYPPSNKVPWNVILDELHQFQKH